jgi:hypothetical protein
VAAYFTGLRLAANNPGCLNVFGDDNFSAAAQTADIPSHDAVVALVRAVDKAGSTDPAAVKSALTSLYLSGADGLAGPGLNFTSGDALSADDIVTLHASTQDPGLRPLVRDDAGARLFWFTTD